jgi:hypothetical protein
VIDDHGARSYLGSGDSCGDVDHGRAGSLQITSETIQVSVEPQPDSETSEDVSVTEILFREDTHSPRRPSRRSLEDGSIQVKVSQGPVQYRDVTDFSMSSHRRRRRALESTLTAFQSHCPLAASGTLSKSLRFPPRQNLTNLSDVLSDGKFRGFVAEMGEYKDQ